jgi:hypothetical protein
LMREVMRIGLLFEMWSCKHVDFNATSEVWPYKLADDFGEACLRLFHPAELAQLHAEDCLFIALTMGFSVKPEPIVELHQHVRRNSGSLRS